ncbi:hypothetical protein N7492_009395 [Penicillium capsulatum]|uniref:Lysine-specific metallo-endopeptidase domain-containing protein n=1 Tax=Penicillium capsulatum TaxID=69766 RepID=A0A9W9HU45_9EURO|nr:hypothetical protein N7492_009395 [Penicillium capsulatum]KAJ6106788.1 hypothetical protein N7512_010305 [Penicillium capsulatum]
MHLQFILSFMLFLAFPLFALPADPTDTEDGKGTMPVLKGKRFNYAGFDLNNAEHMKYKDAYETAWEGSIKLIENWLSESNGEASNIYIPSQGHMIAKKVFQTVLSQVKTRTDRDIWISKEDFHNVCDKEPPVNCASGIMEESVPDDVLPFNKGDHVINCCFAQGKRFQDLYDINSDGLGPILSYKMDSFSATLAHEYIHWDPVGTDVLALFTLGPVLGDAICEDETYGYYAPKELREKDPVRSLRNPDNYAWSATSLETPSLEAVNGA